MQILKDGQTSKVIYIKIDPLPHSPSLRPLQGITSIEKKSAELRKFLFSLFSHIFVYHKIANFFCSLQVERDEEGGGQVNKCSLTPNVLFSIDVLPLPLLSGVIRVYKRRLEKDQSLVRSQRVSELHYKQLVISPEITLETSLFHNSLPFFSVTYTGKR